MNRYEIVRLLRSGSVLRLTGRADTETEATLAALYDHDMIEVQRSGGALLIRWKQPKPRRRYLVERLVLVGYDWFGRAIVRRVLVEVYV